MKEERCRIQQLALKNECCVERVCLFLQFWQDLRWEVLNLPLSKFRKAFDEFDADGSGEIDVHELGTLIKEIGVECSEEDLRGLVDEVDDDGSGEIGFDE